MSSRRSIDPAAATCSRSIDICRPAAGSVNAAIRGGSTPTCLDRVAGARGREVGVERGGGRPPARARAASSRVLGHSRPGHTDADAARRVAATSRQQSRRRRMQDAEAFFGALRKRRGPPPPPPPPPQRPSSAAAPKTIVASKQST